MYKSNQHIHLDSCHIRYHMSPTISYVRMYYIVGPVLDVVYHIIYTISHIRDSVHGHTILDVLYHMFILYSMSTYYIVCMTQYHRYDIRYRTTPWKHIVYDTVCINYLWCRISVTYDIVFAYRIQYRMSCMISYVYIYDVVCYTYDIVCLFWRHLQLTSNFSKDPAQCVYMASVFATPCTTF